MKNKKLLNKITKISCAVMIGMMSISTVAIATSKTSITATKARQIALKKTGGGVVEETELKSRGNVKYYDIEIEKSRVEYEVEVNAATGAIIKFGKDTDDSSDYGAQDSRYGRPGDSNFKGNSGYSNYGGSSGYGDS